MFSQEFIKQSFDHKEITPSCLLISTICSSLRGFVKISSNWSFMLTDSSVMSPFCAWSLRKWCLISICLVLECCTGFFEMFITLVLSHLIGTCLKNKLKSLSVYFIQRICVQHKPAAMYLAFAIDKATKFCFLLCHETSECPRKWQMSLVLLKKKNKVSENLGNTFKNYL